MFFHRSRHTYKPFLLERGCYFFNNPSLKPFRGINIGSWYRRAPADDISRESLSDNKMEIVVPSERYGSGTWIIIEWICFNEIFRKYSLEHDNVFSPFRLILQCLDGLDTCSPRSSRPTRAIVFSRSILISLNWLAHTRAKNILFISPKFEKGWESEDWIVLGAAAVSDKFLWYFSVLSFPMRLLIIELWQAAAEKRELAKDE